ncbi:hypothetical protein LTR95_018070 [Oleoguttula sp. CCFEE 5521]
MDIASRVLAQGVPPIVPRYYRAPADHSGVPRFTLHSRAHGRQSIEAKGQSQQYLTPSEEKAMVEFVLQMSPLGHPLRIKHLPFIALSATRHRSVPDRPSKPPSKNWAKALKHRHPELKARRVKALDWNRHERNIYAKITDWFEVIGKTGVMLSMLGSMKALVGKEDTRDYRGAYVKRTTVTAIECISADVTSTPPTSPTPIRNKVTNGYDEIIKQPHKLKSIRAALTAGTRAVAAAAFTLDSPSEAAASKAGDGSTTVDLERTEDLMPPKAMVNGAQLEREVYKMVCNAVMFIPGEDGLVADTREMFEDMWRLRFGNGRVRRGMLGAMTRMRVK